MFGAGIVRPALISCTIALLVEVPLCVCLSLWGMEAFSYYLSGSTEVALIAKKMWKVSSRCLNLVDDWSLTIT